MRTFYEHAGHKFLLTASGKPSLHAEWTGASISADGVETIAINIDDQDKSNVAPGVAYSIEPVNVSDTYKWTVAPDVKFTAGKLPAPR